MNERTFSDVDIVNALEEAMQLYDACMVEAVTQPAAFGVAVALVAEVLGMSILAAATLVEVEMVKRRKQ